MPRGEWAGGRPSHYSRGLWAKSLRLTVRGAWGLQGKGTEAGESLASSQSVWRGGAGQGGAEWLLGV